MKLVAHSLMEFGSASLDWVSSSHGIGCPYVISVEDRDAIKDATQLLVELIDYNNNDQLEIAS